MNRRIRITPQSAQRLGLRRPGAQPPQPPPRREYLHAARPRAVYLHSDVDYAVTADTVIDDPREASVSAIGILDARGQMLFRVHMPVKTKMGFHFGPPRACLEDITMIVAEDMLSVTDEPEGGTAYIDIDDLDDESP